MTPKDSSPQPILRRLVIVTVTVAMAAIGWILLDEPERAGATESAASVEVGSAVGDAPREIVARVGGAEITGDQLRAAAREDLRELERRLAEERRDILATSLESRIADLLLDAEARRRGMDREALLEAEVTSKLDEVSDDALRAARAAHPEASDAELRRQIRRQAFVDELRRRHDVEVYGERIAHVGD